MTVQELFTLTVGVMGMTTDNASSYLETFVPQVNTILAQTFNLENNNRTFLGLTKLTTIPTVTSVSDTLTYQDSILRKVVIWGIAQIISLSDDDIVKSNFYESRYIDAMSSEGKFIVTDITDYFSGEEE